jgi:3-hydroxyacyl-[acyl-carrier-protein] dehydratase
MLLEYFQLLDRVIDVDLGERVLRAEANVPLASTIFEGHFPGYPLMPGVLLIEAMAQASGWLVIGTTQFKRMPFLAAVNSAKLRSFVTPGQVLAISATLVHDGSGFAKTAASITSDGKKICDAELTFRVMPFPSEDFRKIMEDRAKEIGFPVGTRIDG